MRLCLFSFSFLFVLFIFTPLSVNAQVIRQATTTILVSICGDAIVTPGEACDFGTATNTGAYGTSIENRTCEADCSAFGPYCGDSILQTIFGEECDDGNNVSGDFCDEFCNAEPVPVGTPSGGGGGFSPGSFIPAANAQVSISGKAYPNSDVNILQDGLVVGVVKAAANADFFFTSADVTPGTVTFGFWAEDGNGLRSVSFNTTFQIAQGAMTAVEGVFIPPTIELDKRVVDQGEPISISGQSVPEVTVTTVVQSEPVETDAESDIDGDWEVLFDTTNLENDEVHTAKAKFAFELGDGSFQESGFSQALTFFVGEGEDFIGSADLNRDGDVNLIDFSILIFHWNTDGGDSDPPADINQDGNVTIADFSIMLFNWTG